MDRASWLLKALHEASGEVQEALLAADTPPLPSQPPPSQRLESELPPSELLEIAWDLALGERANGWHAAQLLRGASELTLHPAEWLATGAEPVPVRDLVRIYGQSRAQTCGLVWGLSSRSLALQGRHPFRGLISLEDVLVSLHERDIETMLALQRLPSGQASASTR